jgi:hypothetical protein
MGDFQAPNNRRRKTMTYSRFALLLMPVSLLWTAATLPAQESSKKLEVSPKIIAFLKPIQPAKDDSELVKKMKERHNAAALLLAERIKEYKKGTRDISPVYEAARLAVAAKLDLAETAKAKIDTLEQTLEVARLFENHLQKQFGLGFASKADLERARFARLSMEVELLKAEQKVRPDGNK